MGAPHVPGAGDPLMYIIFFSGVVAFALRRPLVGRIRTALAEAGRDEPRDAAGPAPFAVAMAWLACYLAAVSVPPVLYLLRGTDATRVLIGLAVALVLAVLLVLRGG